MRPRDQPQSRSEKREEKPSAWNDARGRVSNPKWWSSLALKFSALLLFLSVGSVYSWKAAKSNRVEDGRSSHRGFGARKDRSGGMRDRGHVRGG